LGETNVPLHTGHLVFELVKLPPPNGDEERPDEELAEPVLALSKDDADEVADDTPEEDPMPEDPNPPWDPKVSRPWSLLPSPHKARAPFRESIEGVGDVISPDFCLTMPRLAGPSKVDDPRSPILASPHTFLGKLWRQLMAWMRLQALSSDV